MSTHSLRYLRTKLAPVVAEVASSGDEVIVTDGDEEVAVIISMAAYERLQEHADGAESRRIRTMRASTYQPLTLAQVRATLGIEQGGPRED